MKPAHGILFNLRVLVVLYHFLSLPSHQKITLSECTPMIMDFNFYEVMMETFTKSMLIQLDQL